ncbi:hypothetical protein BDK51DRAFT_33486 [Blyttiomyces helicus]|uniref:Uncharacterized protein n=1 Tax=Blyttiomyces helicus TaxID=388810 RepID=A0A4V1IPL6_9FUNG|nr:hypothetical protein BDK51DRAFT_33486 [Blyttiomyces helicus]|eukprot:RKO83487.1 hypothetical protein BDK51DRAFT_33486 [Blyttiomyces helicus]
MYVPINHTARSAPPPLESGRYYLLNLSPFPSECNDRSPLQTKPHEHAGVQTVPGNQKNLAAPQSSCDRDANGWFANVFLGTRSDHTLTKHNRHRFIAESPSRPLPNQPRPPLEGGRGGYICYTHAVRIRILHGSPDGEPLDGLVAYQAAATSSGPGPFYIGHLTDRAEERLQVTVLPAEFRRLVQAHVEYHAGVRYDDDGFAVPRPGNDAAEGDEGDGAWDMVNNRRRRRGRGRGAAVGGGGAAGREERGCRRSRPVLSVSVAHAIDDALVRGAAEVEERRRLMDPATKGQFVPLWVPREPSGLNYPVALLEPDVLHPLEIPHAVTDI